MSSRIPEVTVGGVLSRARRRFARPSGTRAVIRVAAANIAYGLVGMAFVLLLWAVAADASGLPGPADTSSQVWASISDPFFDNGPNDKGIGLLLIGSLQRVFGGFALAAAIGIPLGIAIGANRTIYRIANPVIQFLRPVSPLAWFPIGLVVFKASTTAAVFVIFITAIWPIVLNTAFGVGSVSEDHRNVAKVFKFGPRKYIRRILLPHSLPSIVTGLRISMGIAWLVIVAVEMLSGGKGIGFWVWDSYNAGDMRKVITAILAIGFIGFALDLMFGRLARAVDHTKAVR
ncbi:MAG: nitrate ABC transporter permease [Actinobacteria bacterium]|nr:nitrate ABC transporter permease [Actinomycetota bacterium]